MTKKSESLIKLEPIPAEDMSEKQKSPSFEELFAETPLHEGVDVSARDVLILQQQLGQVNNLWWTGRDSNPQGLVLERNLCTHTRPKNNSYYTEGEKLLNEAGSIATRNCADKLCQKR